MTAQRIVIAILALAVTLTGSGRAQTKRPLQLDDMFTIKRISEPALSPDGKWIVFTLTIPDKEENKNRSDLWITASGGGTAHQLTSDPGNERMAAWSPDGKAIAFESNKSGSYQIWIIRPDGSNEHRFSPTSTESTKPVWSPDGKFIAYVSDVFPEYSTRPFTESDPLNKDRLEELANGKVKAKVFTHLLYRHWDKWVDGKRKHILVQPTAGGDPHDVTPGDNDAVPTSSTFSSGIDFAFSPDGKEIAFTAPPLPIRDQAWSTNHDIYTVPISGGTPKQLTTNPAADGYPRYSPDGRYIAYRAQSVPGFEADRWQLMLFDRTSGSTRSLTKTFDSGVRAPVWSPDSKRLYFEAEKEARQPIFEVSLSGNNVQPVFDQHTNTDVTVSQDGKRLYFTQASATRPAELFSVQPDGKNPRQVTGVNDSLFAQLDIPIPESVLFDGDGGTRIQSWIFKPARFDPSKKYPLVYMVHGGPQGAWEDSWSFRWNPPLWAAQGYVVMAPNPRGSTGFGQKFVNEISRDWGGRVFRDLMKGVDYAEALPYVDKNNKAAAGASFGGYMMNWFQAKAGGRFKTLITHDGVYNFESMYGTTEEVWFDEWEHGKPWDNPDFNKYSPDKFAKDFKTPDLIIHGENDFRVPIGEAMQLFTALQRQGVPSKFLYFPDETHFVSKPLNSELWHRTVFEWLSEYLENKGSRQ